MDFFNKKIAFLGDSITEGVAVTKAENIYHAILGRLWQAREIKNYGISGTRFAKQTKPSAAPSFDKDFIGRVSKIDKDCDFVFVFGGTNDFGHGDAPFGELNDGTAATFCGACHVLFKKLIERFGTEKIICILPIHRTDEDDIYGDGSKTVPSRPLTAYVAAERIIANSYGIKIIDLWHSEKLDPNNENNGIYFADGVHPSDAGHGELAAEINAAFGVEQ